MVHYRPPKERVLTKLVHLLLLWNQTSILLCGEVRRKGGDASYPNGVVDGATLEEGDEVNTCMCSVEHIGAVTCKWGAHGSIVHLEVVFVSKGKDTGGHYDAKGFEKE